ncbi:MAG: RnfABCDGE type electron transport complex subunit D [Candidatus Hydrogenedentes bacterium]|nr:RnfABCDGE type electron transport complex subunit D [Candidatus Hydrogenedentota bacterium]
MSVEIRAIELNTSPHFKAKVSTDQIMLNVVYATMPLCAFAVFTFGLSAFLLIVTAPLACILTEHFFCRMSGKESTVGDYSALITGILLALTLPPGLPLWMAAVGGFVSIALGKMLFGGLGHNPFNPALVGRAFLQAAFPVAITTWSPSFWPSVWSPDRFLHVLLPTLSLPFMKAETAAGYIHPLSIDAFSGATPLTMMKFEHASTPISNLFFGMSPGSTGETSAFLILLCGAYLVYRGMMDWRIPVGVVSSAFLLSAGFYALSPDKYPPPFFTLCSGGLMLGAVFMASDMVGSPSTPLGVWIYAILIGTITVSIRVLGGLPEGVMYAILLGNALTPLINQYTQPRVYGTYRELRSK